MIGGDLGGSRPSAPAHDRRGCDPRLAAGVHPCHVGLQYAHNLAGVRGSVSLRHWYHRVRCGERVISAVVSRTEPGAERQQPDRGKHIDRGAVGPGLAGALIQLLTAPFAILVDAGSLVLSATLMRTIPSREPSPSPSRDPLIDVGR
jgi:hypothetical protein